MEQHCDWRSGGRNGVEPPLPWAWHMAQWCYDPTASALTGRIQLRLPYPQPNWREERVWNAFLLHAMHHTLTAEAVFSRPPDQWSTADKQFVKDMIRGLGSHHDDEI